MNPDAATFTLYWRDGKRELVRGANVADAMNRRGYGNGAVAALDFWARGDDRDYSWAGCEWVRADGESH